MRHHGRVILLGTLVALITLLAAMGRVGTVMARHAAAEPVYGGTIRVAYSGNFISFDPAQAGFDDWAVLNGTLANGLYYFDRNGQPQLELAAAPPIVSADRKTWTFKIRRGVLFSNGLEVTADDVAFSLTRVLDPHLKPAPSWGQPNDIIFQGAQDFANGKAKSVTGIQVLDRYTIRFVLTRPAAVLPDILGESFNFVVPKAVVTHESAEYFGSHPVGAGPFMLQSWTKGSEAVFVRNPRYFRKGVPYLDKIIAYSNVTPSLITLRIEKGDLDGYGISGEMSVADQQQVRTDPTFARYVVTGPTVWVVYLDLNVQAAPLTALAVRQAVAMAFNRTRMVQILGGTADPAGNLYIPLYPQHDPQLDQRPIYDYNPRKAAALLKASGYHGQPITVLYPTDYPQDVSIAPAIEQDLKQIGLNVTLRGITYTTLFALTQPVSGHTISALNWSPDYADGYDLYAAKFTCDANIAGGPGAAHYCDPIADALVNKAEALPLGAERDALLRQAQVRLLRAASRVPLVYLKTLEMVSPKVGGYYYHPLFGWQFESYWLKT